MCGVMMKEKYQDEKRDSSRLHNNPCLDEALPEFKTIVAKTKFNWTIG
jgi:hypothetical protein